MTRTLAVFGLLVFATLAVYLQLADRPFLEYDDGLYVTGNPIVQQGVSVETVAWAFANTDAYIWHPLTWLSYLLDSDLYGIESAGPWLLTNLAWHIAATLALLAALRALTGRFWPCAFVAALFALHPIQVEPVAWVSGRKEVMAGFFLILSLWAYARYAVQRTPARYLALLVAVLLCFGAKGSHVGLPFLLLLLDYWPLGRLRRDMGGRAAAWLLLEKAPILAVAVASIVLHVATASTAYSPWLGDPPLLERAADGAMAYAATVGRLLWPDALAIVYPTPRQMGLPPLAWSRVVGVLALLLAITALAAAAGRRRGYLLVGWLWFLGMLLPMIGLLPSGLRVMHDRYAYVPMIGLGVALAFGAADLRVRLRVPRSVVSAFALALLAVCAFASFRQAQVWRDSLSLFDHALAVTERNAVVHYFRGNTLAARGDHAGAVRDWEAAIAIYPDHAEVHNNLGRVHALRGRTDRALVHFGRAVELRPSWAEALTNLGNAQWASGRRQEALLNLVRGAGRAPDSADAQFWLARALHESGRYERAAESYGQALRLQPGHPQAARGLARLRRERR